MASSNETPPPQSKCPASKAGWLVIAVIVFMLGSVVCGTGSAAAVLFAAVLTLPAAFSKRRVESGLGMLMLLLCLSVGASIYSKEGFGSAYRDYLQRAKVDVTVGLLEQLKPAVESYYAAHHACPLPAQIGASTSNNYAANIHLNRADKEKCVYTAELKTEAGFPAHTTLGLAYLIGSNTWSCHDAATNTTKISPIYLPFRCKN